MIYYVIITEDINSKILFRLNNNFNKKIIVCHLIQINILSTVSNKIKRKIYSDL